MKSFASDNYSGIDPEILLAITEANTEHSPAYGEDPYTEKAIGLLRKEFGPTAAIYFVYNGTAANTLALKAITRNHHAIICTDCAHIYTQEVGAVVNFTGCSILTVPHQDGKLTAESIEQTCLMSAFWGRHTNKAAVVSIAQATEYGTVYSVAELKSIAAICKKYSLLLHMDGCRLANAAAALNVTLRELTADIGVDVLTFGGTKNGLLFGESIIFFNPEIATEFEYIQKQGLQLHSKMRFLSAQFIPYIEKNLWHKNASHANAMTQMLQTGLIKNPEIRIAHPVQTNQLFAYFPEKVISATMPAFPYYIWNKTQNIIRLVTTFDTNEKDVTDFINLALTS
jgi:threonine aldolase